MATTAAHKLVHLPPNLLPTSGLEVSQPKVRRGLTLLKDVCSAMSAPWPAFALVCLCSATPLLDSVYAWLCLCLALSHLAICLGLAVSFLCYVSAPLRHWRKEALDLGLYTLQPGSQGAGIKLIRNNNLALWLGSLINGNPYNV